MTPRPASAIPLYQDGAEYAAKPPEPGLKESMIVK